MQLDPRTTAPRGLLAASFGARQGRRLSGEPEGGALGSRAAQEKSGEPTRAERGSHDALRAAKVFEHAFGGEVPAAHCAFHRGRPTRRCVVAGEEETLDRGALTRSQSIDSGS